MVIDDIEYLPVCASDRTGAQFTIMLPKPVAERARREQAFTFFFCEEQPSPTQE